MNFTSILLYTSLFFQTTRINKNYIKYTYFRIDDNFENLIFFENITDNLYLKQTYLDD